MFWMCATSEAAEKGLNLGEIPENHPAGAKAQRFFVTFMARLKSCPDASGLFIKFLAAGEVMP
jgi:hypothetical protein